MSTEEKIRVDLEIIRTREPEVFSALKGVAARLRAEKVRQLLNKGIERGAMSGGSEPSARGKDKKEEQGGGSMESEAAANSSEARVRREGGIDLSQLDGGGSNEALRLPTWGEA